MNQKKNQDLKQKFSIKNTIEKSQIMPQAIKDKSNKNRVILILILILLPIMLGVLAFLGGL